MARSHDEGNQCEAMRRSIRELKPRVGPLSTPADPKTAIREQPQEKPVAGQTLAGLRINGGSPDRGKSMSAPRQKKHLYGATFVCPAFSI